MHGSPAKGPGVPEAVPRGLQRLGAELGAETLDRVWIFPPLVSGRRESGLLAVSRLTPGDDEDRRVLLTLPYSAERTGKGLVLESAMEEQGEAPSESFPRVMNGVVRRAERDLGEPREIEIGGDAEKFLACLDEFDPALLDPELPPLWQPPPPEEDAAEAGAEGGTDVEAAGELSADLPGEAEVESTVAPPDEPIWALPEASEPIP